MPFFEKMNQADIFVLLTECQFEKNSWTNRCRVRGKWWTNPVKHGLVPIIDKYYTTGQSLLSLNLAWIAVIARTLGIDTKKLVFDIPTNKKGTERIIEICKHYKADQYLTNPEAVDKYLDAKLMADNGIEIVSFKPKTADHVFDLFTEIGIEKARDILHGEKCETKEDTKGGEASGQRGSRENLKVEA